MVTRLGLSVGSNRVRGVLLARGRVTWAGEASYTGASDLVDVVARLATEAGPGAKRIRAVLGRGVAQTRTLTPSPFGRSSLARRYVALDAPRLFRACHAGLVTDAVVVRCGRHEFALWAAAAPTAIVGAIEDGCRQAGLRLETIGVMAEALPAAVTVPSKPHAELAFPDTIRTEIISLSRGAVWRSQCVPGVAVNEPLWRPPLAALNDRTKDFAAAYGAALGRPRLSLLSSETRSARIRRARNASVRRFAAAMGLVLSGMATWTGRFELADRRAEVELQDLQPRLAAVLAIRNDLSRATSAVSTMASAEAQRSNQLELLARITRVAADSLVVVTLTSAGDSLVRLSGYTPVATRLQAALERLPRVGSVRVEIPPTREAVPGRTPTVVWDRFAVAVHLRNAP